MNGIDALTDEQFEERVTAIREDIETKKNFVCDMINETNLFDFLMYEIYKGDQDKMYEALANYYNQAYAGYCDDIISSRFVGWMMDKQTVYSDIKYFKRKLNNLITNQINLKKELKIIKEKKQADQVTLAYQKIVNIDNLDKTITRWKRLIEYLQDYAKKEFPEETKE